MKLNGNFQNLEQSYLFVTIAKKVAAYTQEHPDNKIIKMGIGDVTMPLAPAVIQAMHDATEEQAHKETFHGYSPDSDGYPFLREAIAAQYADLSCPIPPEEVTVTAGSKEALGALFSLWEPGVPVWVCDPVYPAYRAQAEAAGHPVFSLPCRAENDFLPQPED